MCANIYTSLHLFMKIIFQLKSKFLFSQRRKIKSSTVNLSRSSFMSRYVVVRMGWNLREKVFKCKIHLSGHEVFRRLSLGGKHQNILRVLFTPAARNQNFVILWLATKSQCIYLFEKKRDASIKNTLVFSCSRNTRETLNIFSRNMQRHVGTALEIKTETSFWNQQPLFSLAASNKIAF